MGIAYRYYDLRMNIIPLFADRKKAASIWNDTINWWLDSSIKVRFVEIGDEYWIIIGSDSQRPESNFSFFKVLQKSESYERFKKGHDGEAYLRLGIYTKKSRKDVKKDAICDCEHAAEDHDEGDEDACLYKECNCKKFTSFQVTLLKRRIGKNIKTITDIAYLEEKNIKEDSLAWNCLYVNKYSKSD